MPQTSPSPADRPASRRDSTRPPRTRRGSNGTPYPGAPTTSRDGNRTRQRTAATPFPAVLLTRSAESIPATVWATGPDPIDPAAAWPIPIIEAITTSFSAEGARVLLAPWPALALDITPPVESAQDAVTSPSSGDDAAAARDAVEALGRTATLAHLVAGQPHRGVSSRPFWADFVTGSPTPASPADSLADTPGTDAAGASQRRAPEPVDLIITTLPADRSDDGSVDAVALAAAGLLTFGGILAVYTHSDWYSGQLVDPSGPMVAAGQSADLVYLQHIVTLHTPIRDGHLQPPPCGEQSAEHRRAVARARDRGLPVPHVRAHGDLLIFGQARMPVGSCEVKGFQDEPAGGLRRSSSADRSVREEPNEASS